VHGDLDEHAAVTLAALEAARGLAVQRGRPRGADLAPELQLRGERAAGQCGRLLEVDGVRRLRVVDRQRGAVAALEDALEVDAVLGLRRVGDVIPAARRREREAVGGRLLAAGGGEGEDEQRKGEPASQRP
jgi:hypothetical protein